MFSKALPTAFAASALWASVNAHFFMSSPATLPENGVKPPLSDVGADFPCHGYTAWESAKGTAMAAGSQQPIKFELGGGANTAVHGGGSCQVSISYASGAALSDPANWKVLHSFVGSCPSKAKGNLASATQCGGALGECVSNIGFTVPKEVKNGDAVLAWTWFNTIGNREMYMNCAKVTFSGGDDKLTELPNMFTANIGKGCTTTETTNVEFPNPGKYVTKDPSPNYPYAAPKGSCGASGVGAAPAGGSSTGSGTGSGTGSSSGAAPSGSSGSGSPTGTRGGRPTATAPGPIFAENPTQLPSAPANQPGDSGNSGSSGASSSSGSSGSAGTGSGSCTNGVPCSATGFYCIDKKTFGLCASGCAIPQEVAGGTACSGNAVVHALALGKRYNRHLHRRHFLGLSY